jgi:hypothetical protein
VRGFREVVKWLFQWKKPSVGSSKPAGKLNRVLDMHTSTLIPRNCTRFEIISTGGSGSFAAQRRAEGEKEVGATHQREREGPS